MTLNVIHPVYSRVRRLCFTNSCFTNSSSDSGTKIKPFNVTFDMNFLVTHNALLSSEARYTYASALLRNHKTHCKLKMPRVPNLLEQFVSTKMGYRRQSPLAVRYKLLLVRACLHFLEVHLHQVQLLSKHNNRNLAHQIQRFY